MKKERQREVDIFIFLLQLFFTDGIMSVDILSVTIVLNGANI